MASEIDVQVFGNMTRRLFSRDFVNWPGVYLVASNAYVFATYEDFDLGTNHCVWLSNMVRNLSIKTKSLERQSMTFINAFSTSLSPYHFMDWLKKFCNCLGIDNMNSYLFLMKYNGILLYVTRYVIRNV